MACRRGRRRTEATAIVDGELGHRRRNGPRSPQPLHLLPIPCARWGIRPWRFFWFSRSLQRWALSPAASGGRGSGSGLLRGEETRKRGDSNESYAVSTTPGVGYLPSPSRRIVAAWPRWPRHGRAHALPPRATVKEMTQLQKTPWAISTNYQNLIFASVYCCFPPLKQLQN